MPSSLSLSIYSNERPVLGSGGRSLKNFHQKGALFWEEALIRTNTVIVVLTDQASYQKPWGMSDTE